MGIDDANIYFVYMRNFANDFGFVFNQGGERVEGFTSLLWTLIGSVFFRMSNNPEIYLLIFNVLIVSFSLWRVVQYIDNESSVGVSSKWVSMYSFTILILLFITPGYFDFSVLSLMETGLWGSILIIMSLNILTFNSSTKILKCTFELSFWSVLLILTRPEAMLIGPLFFVARGVQIYFRVENIKSTLLSLSGPVLIFIFSLVRLLLWRISYFGFPYPNTYYAKVSADRIDNLYSGVVYLIKFFYLSPLSFVVVLCCILFLSRCVKFVIKGGSILKLAKENFTLFFLISLIFLSLLIPLITGGDHFNYSRFMQPILPLIMIVLILLMRFYNFKLSAKRMVLLIVISVFTSLPTMSRFMYGSELMHEWSIAKQGREKSKMLNSFFGELPKLPSQGVLVAGGQSYSYNGYSIDLLGLNNVEMAHAKSKKDRSLLKNHGSFNKEVFYSLKPDLFWLGGGFIDSINLDSIIVRDFNSLISDNIRFDQKFKTNYLSCLIIKRNEKRALKIFAHADFISNLEQFNYQVKILSQ